jgi:hypothetical protein
VSGAQWPQAPLSGYCACAYVTCDHPKGSCPELPVIVEKQRGLPVKLCAKCAERWGYSPRPEGE